eukprot:6175263-Pleurochrysis_carterae.AAC.1
MFKTTRHVAVGPWERLMASGIERIKLRLHAAINALNQNSTRTLPFSDSVRSVYSQQLAAVSL